MALDISEIELQKKENRIFKSLLYIFSDEVLRDFQNCISEMYKEPTSLWAFNSKGNLQQLKTRKEDIHNPAFCNFFCDCVHVNGVSRYCYKKNKEQISYIIKDYLEKKDEKKWFTYTCHLGVSRLIFPLKINENIVGALTFGKFRQGRKDNNNIESKIDELIELAERKKILNSKFDPKREFVRTELKKRISRIKKVSKTELGKKAEAVSNLIPFLNAQYAKYKPSKQQKGSFIDGFVFLENLEYRISDIFISHNSLWMVVDDILAKLAEKLGLSSALIYFTDKDDYQRLFLKSSYPKMKSFPKELALSSYNELTWLIDKQRGIIVPTKFGSISWINEYVDKFSITKEAIVYADNIYHQKNVFLAFGFKENVYLTDFEKILLRISVSRLNKFIRHVVSKIELDDIMIATGHKLRRTHGALQGSINSLTRYGVNPVKAKSKNQKEIIQLSRNSLESGLMQLDLITRNYHAFSDLSWIPKQDGQEVEDAIDKIDLCGLLKKFKNFYKIELEEERKKFLYKFNLKSCFLYNNELAVQLLFWNLIDNAIKFSYNDTYIEVKLNEIDNIYRIEINNRGLGIPTNESEYIFEEYYKSSYFNKVKEISGQGIGLSICKRCMDRFFPSGKISIKSWKAPKKYGGRRFEGDNYITSAVVEIPVISNLYNQFLYRGKK